VAYGWRNKHDDSAFIHEVQVSRGSRGSCWDSMPTEPAPSVAINGGKVAPCSRLTGPTWQRPHIPGRARGKTDEPSPRNQWEDRSARARRIRGGSCTRVRDIWRVGLTWQCPMGRTREGSFGPRDVFFWWAESSPGSPVRRLSLFLLSFSFSIPKSNLNSNLNSSLSSNLWNSYPEIILCPNTFQFGDICIFSIT
jgi:hypothetical protein